MWKWVTAVCKINEDKLIDCYLLTRYRIHRVICNRVKYHTNYFTVGHFNWSTTRVGGGSWTKGCNPRCSSAHPPTSCLVSCLVDFPGSHQTRFPDHCRKLSVHGAHCHRSLHLFVPPRRRAMGAGRPRPPDRPPRNRKLPCGYSRTTTLLTLFPPN